VPTTFALFALGLQTCQYLLRDCVKMLWATFPCKSGNRKQILRRERILSHFCLKTKSLFLEDRKKTHMFKVGWYCVSATSSSCIHDDKRHSICYSLIDEMCSRRRQAGRGG